jgi:hypothetical protein
MVEGTVGKELLELERQYWNAIVYKDASSAADLSDDPCVVVGAQGVGELDKQALAGMLENSSYDLKEYGIEDVHVRPIAEGVVVVAYKVKEKLVVDGEQVALEAFDSSVWVRRRGRKWVCALHTESLAGDPFGRH